MGQGDLQGFIERLFGFCGCDAVSELRDWTDDEVRVLRFLGSLIGGAIGRREDEEVLRRLLKYPDDTAGGLMDVDAASVRADVTIKTVLRFLRQLRAREGGLPEHLDSLMVVDRDNRYVGIIRLSDVASLETSVRVRDAMQTDVPAIHVLTPSTAVARQFEDKDLISAAVVDEHGALVGRITIDDVVDVIREEADHSLMSMAGLDEDDDIFAPVVRSARRRAVWLGINLATAFLASWIIGLFESTLDKVVALAVLMPIVASMGGIAGSQTLTIMIRGLALGQVGSGNARSLMYKEIMVSVMNGLIWSLVVALIAIAWFQRVEIGIIIGCAIVINLVCAAVAGFAIPLLLRRIGIDPALAGSVLLTTVTDVVGFMAFLGLGTLYLL